MPGDRMITKPDLSRTVESRAHQDRCCGDLMRLAQEGDRAAYSRLLGEIVPLLRCAIRQKRSFLQPADIEDILQNILLAVHKSRATYDPERSFLPWLFAIARNQIAESARRYARRAVNEVNVAEIPETYSSDATKNDTEAYGDGEALKAALCTLPVGQQRAIEMLKLKEMTLKEAAAASGMTIAALKVSVHRAMLVLRKALRAEA